MSASATARLASNLCKCDHARSQHLGDEVCVHAGCDCSRYSAKGRRGTLGLGADATTQNPLYLDSPTREDGNQTLLDRVASFAEAATDDEDDEADAVQERGRAAYVAFVTRSLRMTAERQWTMYLAFARGAPLTAIAEKSGKHVATVYEAVNRVRAFLRSEYGVETPTSFQRPNTLLERRRAKARDLLRNTRLTQKKIAEATGLDQSSVSAVCRAMVAAGEQRGRGLQEIGELCRNGHPRTPRNTLVNKKGHRRCRLCSNANHARWLKNRRSQSGPYVSDDGSTSGKGCARERAPRANSPRKHTRRMQQVNPVGPQPAQNEGEG